MTAPTTPGDGLRAAIEAALATEVGGHSLVLAKGPTTESGWLHHQCSCGDFAWPCPHVLIAQVEATKAALAAHPAPTPVAGEGDGLAWEAGVRQAIEWLRADYEYGTGPAWRENGAEWIAERLTEHRREATP